MIHLINDGQIIGGSANITGAAGQLVVDGSSNANGAPAIGGNGIASFILSDSLLSLTNNAVIMDSFNSNVVRSVGQLVFDGTCNQSAVGPEAGNASSLLTTDNSSIVIKNYGSITAQNSENIAAQLIFDGSDNGNASLPTGTGSAVFNAGSNSIIFVTNEMTGTILATSSNTGQIYFHNASIYGSPHISVSNLNPSITIPGIIFDQNSSAGNATISLENNSLCVNTTPSEIPFSIDGLNGNSNSSVSLMTNDLKINTELDAITSFAGNIMGSGKNLIIDGMGKQRLSGNNSFSGSTQVNGGTLELDGSVATSVFVNNGTITGAGSIGDDLTFSTESTYLVTISGTPFSTTCLHVGGLLTPAGALKIVSSNETYSIGFPYTILTAGALSSTKFSSISISSPWLIVTPYYYSDPSVTITLSTNFLAGAQTQNQENVAEQIDGIALPSGDEDVVINELIHLNSTQLTSALDELAGEPYTYFSQVNQFADRRFSKRLFEAVREATLPSSCSLEASLEASLEEFLEESQEVKTWSSVEGGLDVTRGNREVAGFSSTFFDISLGAQLQINPFLLAGVATNYQKNWLHFNGNANNILNNGQAGIYALWRDCSFYVFSDVIGGHSYSHFKRHIRFGSLNKTARSHFKFYHGLWYGEVGVDFQWCDLIIQPFFGLDVIYVSGTSFRERHASSLNLKVKSHQTTSPDTYLGVHLNYITDCVEVSTDLVWQYSYGSQGTTIHSRFVDFGNVFKVKGSDSQNHFLIGRFKVTGNLSNDIQTYLEGSGGCSISKQSSSYNWSASGGICYAW